MSDNIDNRGNLPFLTSEIAGIGGVLKLSCEDFRVIEDPLYPCDGYGTHVFAFIEKTGMSTMAMIGKVAKALGKNKRDIGYAGQKDAQAITSQWISIEHIDESELNEMDIEGVKVLDIVRHGNKLKLNHLDGNQFIIRLRQMQEKDLAKSLKRAKEVLEVLKRRGVPNYYGQQRFGNYGNNAQLGAAIIRGDKEGFMDIMLGGEPLSEAPEHEILARSLYEQGKYEEAIDAWGQKGFYEQKKMLSALARGKTKVASMRAIDRQRKKFYISAFQSDLFNQILARRITTIDSVGIGDIAYKHDNGSCFLVEDADIEQVRCKAFEVSPTGAIFGHKMIKPTGQAEKLEAEILSNCGVTIEDIHQRASKFANGTRRPLRFKPKLCKVKSGSDTNGDYLEFAFLLPPGCYATTLLREVIK